MRAAGRAFARGIWTVGRAPGLLLAVSVLTLISVLPFAVVMEREIQTALAHQPPIDLAAQEIDAEWWLEYRRHASGLASTFTPAILGFAAPLENLSALLDGTPRSWALAAPLVVYAGLWAFLWGPLLRRFDLGRRIGFRAALSAGAKFFLPFVAITVFSGVAVLAAYWTIHAWLFGPVYGVISEGAGSEPLAFTGRVALYLVFGAVLASISLATDYTRVALVVRDARSLRGGFATALQFLRENFLRVTLLFLLTAATLAMVFAAFGVADLRFGGWRAVILGQAFIVARLALRLTTAAAQVSLYKQLTTNS